MQLRQIHASGEGMALSLVMPQEKLQKSPPRKPFSPLRPIGQINFIKKQQLQPKQKKYKSIQRLPTANTSINTAIDLSASSHHAHAENNELQSKQKGHYNHAKFLKIKQKYGGEKGTMIPDHFCKPLKMPMFLKTHSAQNQETMVKQFEAVLKPKPKLSFIPSEKSIPKVFLKPSKQRQFKTLLINNKKEVFQMVKFLDQGSYGKVHLVQHVATQAIYCLKIIEKCQLNEQSFNQLVRESIIQSYLNHPNIINLYSFTADAEFVYLLLEACPGQNLYKRLNQKPFREKDVRKYIKQVCGAVEYMHKNDVIHRDIKPENILILENTVKICDFGWAVHSPLMRNTQCGTPLYTPPEMVKYEYYDSKIDIWCIGVLTYELLYGTIPFEIRHPNDLSRIVSEDVYFSKEVQVTDEAKHFIRKCLEKNAHERYNIRQALEDDFLATKMGENFRHTLS